jgi:hypothetical protein
LASIFCPTFAIGHCFIDFGTAGLTVSSTLAPLGSLSFVCPARPLPFNRDYYFDKIYFCNVDCIRNIGYGNIKTVAMRLIPQCHFFHYFNYNLALQSEP